MATNDQQSGAPVPPAPPPPQGTAPSSAESISQSIAADLEDRSKYIRTMAKDMAELEGAAVPPPKQKKKKEEPAKAPEVVSGIELPKTEEPFFSKPEPKVQQQEAVDLPSMAEAASIVAPAEEVPAAPPLPSPEDLERDRAKVLERLRAKAQAEEQKAFEDQRARRESLREEVTQKVAEMPPAPVAPPPPAPATEWPGIPAPPPQFAAAPEPKVERMPPVTKETYREPIEPPAPKTAPEPLHTYTSDFADRIDERRASTFSVLAAEQDAKPAPVRESAPPRRIGKVLATVGGGTLLVLFAIGGIIGTYQLVMTMRDTPLATLTVPTIVFADEYRELSATGGPLASELAAVAEGTLVPGNVLVAYVMERGTDEEGLSFARPAGGADFVRALVPAAPDILLRNITDDSTVGVINVGETRPFFALRVGSYERTYAGMLTWEPLMPRDLAAFYPLYPAPQPVLPDPEDTASTTATTTPGSDPAPSVPLPAQALTRFADAVVANHDVRVLRDTAGKSIVLYGYSADRRTLIIARDEAAFEALVDRLKEPE